MTIAINCIQVKEFKKDMAMPAITKTGGASQGAQFDFDGLFLERLQQEVRSYTFGAVITTVIMYNNFW